MRIILPEAPCLRIRITRKGEEGISFSIADCTHAEFIKFCKDLLKKQSISIDVNNQYITAICVR